jgi:hypothetical protein
MSFEFTVSEIVEFIGNGSYDTFSELYFRFRNGGKRIIEPRQIDKTLDPKTFQEFKILKESNPDKTKLLIKNLSVNMRYKVLNKYVTYGVRRNEFAVKIDVYTISFKCDLLAASESIIHVKTRIEDYIPEKISFNDSLRLNLYMYLSKNYKCLLKECTSEGVFSRFLYCDTRIIEIIFIILKKMHSTFRTMQTYRVSNRETIERYFDEITEFMDGFIANLI